MALGSFPVHFECSWDYQGTIAGSSCCRCIIIPGRFAKFRLHCCSNYASIHSWLHKIFVHPSVWDLRLSDSSGGSKSCECIPRHKNRFQCKVPWPVWKKPIDRKRKRSRTNEAKECPKTEIQSQRPSRRYWGLLPREFLSSIHRPHHIAPKYTFFWIKESYFLW